MRPISDRPATQHCRRRLIHQTCCVWPARGTHTTWMGPSTVKPPTSSAYTFLQGNTTGTHCSSCSRCCVCSARGTTAPRWVLSPSNWRRHAGCCHMGKNNKQYDSSAVALIYFCCLCPARWLGPLGGLVQCLTVRECCCFCCSRGAHGTQVGSIRGGVGGGGACHECLQAA